MQYVPHTFSVVIHHVNVVQYAYNSSSCRIQSRVDVIMHGRSMFQLPQLPDCSVCFYSNTSGLHFNNYMYNLLINVKTFIAGVQLML